MSITQTLKNIRLAFPAVMAKHDSTWNCIKLTTAKTARGFADYDNGPEIDLGHDKESRAEACAEAIDTAAMLAKA